jgi:hypothetical protein
MPVRWGSCAACCSAGLPPSPAAATFAALLRWGVALLTMRACSSLAGAAAAAAAAVLAELLGSHHARHILRARPCPHPPDRRSTCPPLLCLHAASSRAGTRGTCSSCTWPRKWSRMWCTPPGHTTGWWGLAQRFLLVVFVAMKFFQAQSGLAGGLAFLSCPCPWRPAGAPQPGSARRPSRHPCRPARLAPAACPRTPAQGGKRARLRDMGLWADPPEYYGGPEGFVAVDLDPVEVRYRTACSPLARCWRAAGARPAAPHHDPSVLAVWLPQHAAAWPELSAQRARA